jgi:lipopolysaccharide export LptBFGC system permease protein LptF
MTIQRHMFVQLLVASLVVTGSLSGIIILTIVFKDIPSALLYSRGVLTFALGVLPVNLYTILPVGVAIAATWYYTNLVSDHAVHALYATGFSYFSVILPGLLLALLATVFGLYLSLVEGPRGWTRLLDAIYVATHDVDPSSLEPQRFYTLNDDSRTFYFGRRLAENEIAEVFIQERTKGGGERSISSPIGSFVRTPSTTLLYLADAVLQTRKAGEHVPTMVTVNKLWIDSGMRGTGTPERNARYLAEMGSAAFAAASNQGDANYRREWIREAFKRTVPPILTITYLLVAVRLGLLGLAGRHERPWILYVISAGIILHHGLLLLAIDALISLDARMAWAIVTVVLLEVCGSIALNPVPSRLIRDTLAPSPRPSIS